MGVRVVDLADESAGLAGRILADLGADVVLVEPPDGVRARRLAPFIAEEPGVERSCVHQVLNANKRSAIITDASQLHSLMAAADVVLHSDPSFFFDHGPGPVRVGVTPFGPDGLRSSWLGSDLVGAAAGGLLWVSGERSDPPTRGAAEVAFTMAALAAATAAIIGLRARDRSPDALVEIDISVQEATQMCVLQTANPTFWRWFGKVPGRPGLSGALRCADGGYVSNLVRPDAFGRFLAWLDAVGVPHTMVPADWRIARLLAPAPNHPVGAALIGLAARLSRDEFVEGALRHGVVCSPILGLDELAGQEHYVVNRQFITVDHEGLGDDDGPLRLPFLRSPVDTSDDPLPIVRAPMLGEHTNDVLAELRGTSTRAYSPTPNPMPSPTPTTPLRADPAQALEGIRVVDFTWVIAGPLGTRILASFGADVIRIESTTKPDSTRSSVGPDGEPDPDLGGLYNDLNVGKRSVSVDLTTAEGRAVVERLVRGADVVVNNFRPGALERMGFGFDALRSWKPDIVLLNLPGMHRNGPWSSRPSMGHILMGLSGFSSITGFPGRSPRGIGIPYPDFTSPYLLAATVIAALRRRDNTGEGAELHLTQLSAMVSLLGVEWMHLQTTGSPLERPGNRDRNHAPHGVFACVGDDEWCAIAVRDDDEFGRLCGVMDRSDLAADPRFETHADRKRNEDALDAEVATWARGLDRWVLAERCQSAGVRAAPVENLEDLMDRDPSAERHYQTVRQPVAPEVAIPVDAECMRFRDAPLMLRRAPGVGEHNEAVVRDELDYSDDEYLALVINDVLL